MIFYRTTFIFFTFFIGEDAKLPYVSLLIQYPLVVASFFLSCFAEKEPKYNHLDGNIFEKEILYCPTNKTN